MRVAIVTASDRSARGECVDGSGPLLAQLVRDAIDAADVVEQRIVADDLPQLRATLRELCTRADIDLVLTTGGTGLDPRDVTPDAVRAVIDRDAPGLPELMRAAGLQHTPMAALSRQVAGQRDGTLVVTLPGSPKAVAECFAAIAPVLAHAVELVGRTVVDAPNRAVAVPRIVTGLVAEAIDSTALLSRIEMPESGAVVSFQGTTRSPSRGAAVARLEYEAYARMAEPQLAAIAREVADRHGANGVVLVHRTGAVAPGETSILTAASCPHRAPAFAACEELLERAKHEVAVFKREVLVDDGARWVGLPDEVAASDPAFR